MDIVASSVSERNTLLYVVMFDIEKGFNFSFLFLIYIIIIFLGRVHDICDVSLPWEIGQAGPSCDSKKLVRLFVPVM